ncbi:unnamed protein product [Trifolium pratense]|uniref:Uncharacterized protein n=1 Tax=Trifolium pratense TaxID=57577 RepID=A0ACB0IFD4_TRIPR|nr:unnamed protein product [Trifolium pratense]
MAADSWGGSKYVERETPSKLVEAGFQAFENSVLAKLQKDFQTGMMLMRCNNLGDLYPITTRQQTTASPPSTYAALSNELWHNRLGHPGAPVLSSLHRNNFLICNKFRNNFFLSFLHSWKTNKATFL